MTETQIQHLVSPMQEAALNAKAAADCALITLDPQGTIRFWSPGAEHIKGYTATEIVGQNFSCLYTEAARQTGEPQRTLAIAAAHGRYETEGLRLRKDGSTFWASVVIEPITGDEGQIIGYSKITRDVTDRKIMHEEIVQGRAKYQAIIETAADGIIVVNEHGIIQAFNRAAEIILGYAADEVINRNVAIFVPEPHRSHHDRNISQFRQTGEISMGREVTGLRKDGSIFPIDLSIAKWHADGQCYFTAIVRDITARKESEEHLKLTLTRLHRAQKMEVMGRITGGIAHDFNNILQVMMGSLDLADAHAENNDDLQRLLSTVRRGAQRAGRMTQQLLAFSRQQPLKPEEINVQEHMREAVDLFARTLRGNIYVEVDLPSDLWPIKIDVSQLDLAVLNIAVNARDAMPNGGTFKISARNATYQGLTIEQGNHGLNGSYVVLNLSDTGAGIPPEVLPHVFEPFFTTKDIGKGTGLGLSQVYGFALQSGGVATVASKPGEGTSVTLCLPAHDREATGTATDDRREATTPIKGTVLVVEDDADVAEVATRVLKNAGYAVALVEDASGALLALAAGARANLVFSDILLPNGMNGITLAHKVRTLYPEIPVVLTTGYAEALANPEASGLLVLQKPYSSARLLSVIDGALRNATGVGGAGSFVDPPVSGTCLDA
jgi:PAS domain S-box-containing protein